jgi:amino acid permease
MEDNTKHQVSHSEDHSSHFGEKSVNEIQIEHVPEGTAGAGKALFMLLKAFVGTGVIFLPGAFQNGGLVLSIVLMVVIASICLVAFQLLVIAQREVGGSYGDMARTLYGSYLRYLVLFFLCISQIGFVSSYLIFISENIQLVVQALNQCYTPFESKYYIWIVLGVVIPLCWVRKIARLSYCAIIADIFILFGLICVLYYTSNQIHLHGAGPNIKLVNNQDFALMIGTATFSFEGIGMVVPVIEGMKHPEKFPRVLTIGMIIITLIFTLIGTMGYVAYGDKIKASVVTNIPTEPLSVTVQLLYSIAMILTAPFMLWPPLNIVTHGLFGHKRSGRISWVYKWGKNFVRTLVPIVSAAISFGVGADNLDKFVSLVGIVACLPLCFIFPGMFHYKITRNWWLRAVDIVLIMWGAGILVYTLYVNVNSWVHPAAASGEAAQCTSL